MRRGSPRAHAGFFLIEVLLGITIFAIFLSSIAMVLIYGQENTVNAGDRMRGAYLTERTMEAVRAIRGGSFSSVSTGTKGVWIDKASNVWAFSGSSVTVSGAYVVSVAISSIASDWLAFTGTTTWKHGYHRAGTVRLAGEMTDWRGTVSVGNWVSPTLEGSLAPGGTPQFNKVVTAGNVAYVTSEDTTGLYMIDISSTVSPARLNSGFSLGIGATGIAVRGKRLYVLTKDPSAELKVYNISTASSPVYMTSYDVPGSALGTAVTIGWNSLYITSAYSAVAGEYELYALNISNSGSVVLQMGVDDTESMNAIAVTGTSALIASAHDWGELRTAIATSTGGLALYSGYNLPDRTLNGTAVAVSGTSALLGTQKGGIQEVVLFDISTSGYYSPGPWYHEGSGTIMDLAMDPHRCFGFIAASTNKKAFQVFDLKNKATLTEHYAYDSSSGLARGLTYDPVRDRVYVLTDSSFLVFKPAAAAGTCP